jgi:hypothetical protein
MRDEKKKEKKNDNELIFKMGFVFFFQVAIYDEVNTHNDDMQVIKR